MTVTKNGLASKIADLENTRRPRKPRANEELNETSPSRNGRTTDEANAEEVDTSATTEVHRQGSGPPEEPSGFHEEQCRVLSKQGHEDPSESARRVLGNREGRSKKLEAAVRHGSLCHVRSDQGEGQNHEMAFRLARKALPEHRPSRRSRRTCAVAPTEDPDDEPGEDMTDKGAPLPVPESAGDCLMRFDVEKSWKALHDYMSRVPRPACEAAWNLLRRVSLEPWRKANPQGWRRRQERPLDEVAPLLKQLVCRVAPGEGWPRRIDGKMPPPVDHDAIVAEIVKQDSDPEGRQGMDRDGDKGPGGRNGLNGQGRHQRRRTAKA
ncbi:hypothetical protein FQA39_LY19404 [Lamprigera yunnana]|nr:hypothetical protein FQA39_LY19404 [Lamprigera yunnana]